MLPRTSCPERQAAAEDRPFRNPFATCNWVPGRLPLWLPEGQTLPGLAARLARQRFQGQIAGPHGSGKSTLLWHLRHHLLRHEGARCLARGRTGPPGAAWWKLHLPDPDSGPRQTLWLIDGWERLPLWQKLFLRLGAWQGAGLIVTSHTPTGLPLLVKTQATVALLEHVLEHLNAEPARLLRPGETLQGLLDRHGGNLREVLFELYDRYERK